ncbi:clathrin light chain [Clavulina sp. PMI_390]|nr:clathrin light chain [Clavulina sp. PMI_390]
MSDDFLAREQELLGGAFSSSGLDSAGGGGEVDFSASAFPDLDALDGNAPIPSAPSRSIPSGLGDGFGDFDAISPSSAAPATDVKVTGDADLDQFESQYPDLDGVSQSTQPSFQPAFLAQAPSQPSFQTPLYPTEAEEEEPEVIREWRTKQEEEIRQRDEASLKKKRETIAKAEQSIDDFYKDYNSKIERNVKQNKDSEVEFAAAQEAALSAGTTWSRISDLVELQNSQSKTIARAGPGTTDLARYKEILLRLKREGENAPGAGGY